MNIIIIIIIIIIHFLCVVYMCYTTSELRIRNYCFGSGEGAGPL